MTIPERIKKIIDECQNVWSTYGVTSWERDRLDEWKNRTSLSPGQEKILVQIEAKVFPEDDDLDRIDDDEDRHHEH